MGTRSPLTPILLLTLFAAATQCAEPPSTKFNESGRSTTLPLDAEPAAPPERLAVESANIDGAGAPGMGANQGPGGGFGGPGGSRGPGLSELWFPKQNFSGNPYSLASSRTDLRLGAPIWLEGSTKVIGTVNLSGSYFSVVGRDGAAGPLLLPGTDRPFPKAVGSASFGVMTVREFDNGWSGTLNVNIGSASDRPFHGLREMNFGMMSSLRVPSGDSNAWLFSVVYMPTSQLWFPIPGIAYLWNPNPDLSLTIGIPFAVRWRFVEEWNFEATYLPVTNVTARFTRRIGERGQIHFGYSANNESYMLVDRAEYQDRFFYFDQRLAAGFVLPVGERWNIDASTGYAFNRYYAEGQSSLGSRENRLDLDSGLFAALRIGLTF